MNSLSLVKLIFLVQIFFQIHCTLTYRHLKKPVQFNSNYNTSFVAPSFYLRTIDFSYEENFAGLCVIASQDCYYFMQGKDSLKVRIPAQPIIPNARLFTHPSNNGETGKFLILNEQKVILLTNLQSFSQLLSSPVNHKFQNVVLGATNNEFYLLSGVYTDGIKTGYKIQYYIDAELQSELQINETQKHDDLFLDGDYIYISFLQSFYVLDYELKIKMKISRPGADNTDYTAMTTNSVYICSSVNMEVKCFHKFTFDEALSLSVSEKISDIKLQSSYLLIASKGRLRQYDYQVQRMFPIANVQSSELFSIGYSQPMLGLFLFKPHPNKNEHLLEYLYTAAHMHDCSIPGCPCYDTYEKEDGYNCIKKIELFQEWSSNLRAQLISQMPEEQEVDPPQQPQEQQEEQQEQEQGQEEQEFQEEDQNQDFQQIESQPLQPQNPEKQDTKEQNQIRGNGQSWIYDFLEHVWMNKTTQFIGKSLTFTSFKIAPNFLLSFTGFLDDIWFYQYHSYSYPKSVQIFMQKIDIINYFRLSPWFLNFLNFFQQSYVCQKRNQQRHQILAVHENDPEQVYFLNAAEDTYKSNLIMNCAFLIVLKFIMIVVKKIKEKVFSRPSQTEMATEQIYKQKLASFNEQLQFDLEDSYKQPHLLKRTLRTLRECTKIWTLLTAVLERNMLKLSFDCFIQLLSLSNYDLVDKFNLLFTLTCLFLLILYFSCFYPLVYRFNSKKSASNLLINTKYSLQGFFLCSVYYVFRNFFRAFIHAFLIRNYELQMILLLLSDIVFVFLSFKMYNYFELRSIGILSLMYSIIFMLFDLFFLFKVGPLGHKINSWNSENISFVLVASLALIAVIISLIEFFIFLYQVFREMKKICFKKYKNQITHSQETLQNKKRIASKSIKYKPSQTKRQRIQRVQNLFQVRTKNYSANVKEKIKRIKTAQEKKLNTLTEKQTAFKDIQIESDHSGSIQGSNSFFKIDDTQRSRVPKLYNKQKTTKSIKISYFEDKQLTPSINKS